MSGKNDNFWKIYSNADPPLDEEVPHIIEEIVQEKDYANDEEVNSILAAIEEAAQKEDYLEVNEKESLGIIIMKVSGVPIISRQLHGRSISKDTNLVSGMATALNNFSMEITGSEIRSVRTQEDYCLIIDALRDLSDFPKQNRKLLSELRIVTGTHNGVYISQVTEKHIGNKFNQPILEKLSREPYIGYLAGPNETKRFEPLENDILEVYDNVTKEAQGPYNIRLFDQINKMDLTPPLRYIVEEIGGKEISSVGDDPKFVRAMCKLLNMCPVLLSKNLREKLKENESASQIEEIFQARRIMQNEIEEIQAKLTDLKKVVGREYDTINGWAQGIQEHYSNKLLERIGGLGNPALTEVASRYLNIILNENSGDGKTREEIKTGFRDLISSYEDLNQIVTGLYNQFRDIGVLLGVKMIALPLKEEPKPSEIYQKKTLTPPPKIEFKPGSEEFYKGMRGRIAALRSYIN